jgi:hypothetical protein
MPSYDVASNLCQGPMSGTGMTAAAAAEGGAWQTLLASS